MKKTLAVFLSLLPTPAFAVTQFATDVLAVQKAVQQNKGKDLNEGISLLIQTMRESRDRAAKLHAVSALEDMFRDSSYLDKHRIISALVDASRDIDREMRHYPIRALGRIAEGSAQEFADKISDELGGLMRASQDRSERTDLIAAFSEASRSADPSRGQGAEQFLDAVKQELRDGAVFAGDQGKATAMLALNNYTSMAGPRLASTKRALLQKLASDLMDYAQYNPSALEPRGGNDADSAFRFAFARELLMLGNPHATWNLIQDPGLRQRIKDRLVRMHQDETSQTIKNYIGWNLGYPQIVR